MAKESNATVTTEVSQSPTETDHQESSNEHPEESRQDQSQDNKGEKLLTQEEVNKIVAKTRAQERERSKAQVDEAKKLAKMSADEKRQFELEKSQAHEKELESQIARYEMRDTARSILNDKGLSNVSDDELALIVTDNAESTQENANVLLKLIERVKEETRNELTKGTTPHNLGGSKKELTKAEFDKLTYAEKVDLKVKDPDLYAKLAKYQEVK